jgi:hypothetical protein
MNTIRSTFSLAVVLMAIAASQGTAQVARSIAGLWTISDAKSLQGKSYTGTVTITPTDKFYKLDWHVGNISYSGLGFFENGHLFAGWGSGPSYGLVVYDIASNGSLNGKWVFNGGNYIGIEKSATGALKGDRSRFSVVGTNPDGTNYTGQLTVEKKGQTYQLSWTVADRTFPGVGIRVGNQLVVGWGLVHDIGVISYDVSGDRAVGRWALPAGSTLGSETIVRAR